MYIGPYICRALHRASQITKGHTHQIGQSMRNEMYCSSAKVSQRHPTGQEGTTIPFFYFHSSSSSNQIYLQEKKFHPCQTKVRAGPGTRNPIVFLSAYLFSQRLIGWLKYLFDGWNIYGCTRVAALYPDPVASCRVPSLAQPVASRQRPPRRRTTATQSSLHDVHLFIFMINTSFISLLLIYN